MHSTYYHQLTCPNTKSSRSKKIITYLPIPTLLQPTAKHTSNIVFTNINKKTVIDPHIIHVIDSSLPIESASTSKNTIQASNKKYNNLQPPAVSPEHMWGNNIARTSSNVALHNTTKHTIVHWPSQHQSTNHTVDSSNFLLLPSKNLHQKSKSILPTVPTHTTIIKSLYPKKQLALYLL